MLVVFVPGFKWPCPIWQIGNCLLSSLCMPNRWATRILKRKNFHKTKMDTEFELIVYYYVRKLNWKCIMHLENCCFIVYESCIGFMYNYFVESAFAHKSCDKSAFIINMSKFLYKLKCFLKGFWTISWNGSVFNIWLHK